MRFTSELQIVYTISHWGLDGNWALNLTGVNDTIHILRRYQAEMNWPVLAGWIAEKPWVYPNIAVLTSYLHQTEIFWQSEEMREALAHSGIELAPQTTRLLFWLLHNYPFNAREKSRHGYATWRAHAVWQDPTAPYS